MGIRSSNGKTASAARIGVLTGLVFAGSTSAHAEGLKTSGFASFVLGQTSGACSSVDPLLDKNSQSCTRYIVDWAHGAVMTNRLAANRETRAGLQADYTLNRQWSATAQITARTLPEQHLNLETAYLTWALTPDWKLQAGRRRLPLYYYSDFQDVGFAYNMVRPAPEVYGWEMVNYNGVGLSTAQSLGGAWSMRAEAYVGSETSKDNPYMPFALVAAPTEVTWSAISGFTLEFSRDWFTGRVSYSRSQHQLRDQASGEPLELYDGSVRASQEFYGIALNGDWDLWQLRSEIGSAKRAKASGYDGHFYVINLGRRFGAFTATGSMSKYRETTPYDPSVYIPIVLQGRSLALRYDVHKGGALKLQLDRVTDKGSPTFTGNARAITMSYDLVF